MDYVTRCLGAGPGVKGGPDGHHGVNEIWSNKFSKWYLSGAKYNHHEPGGCGRAGIQNDFQEGSSGAAARQ